MFSKPLHDRQCVNRTVTRPLLCVAESRRTVDRQLGIHRLHSAKVDVPHSMPSDAESEGHQAPATPVRLWAKAYIVVATLTKIFLQILLNRSELSCERDERFILRFEFCRSRLSRS